jgi:hypothetical protein
MAKRARIIRDSGWDRAIKGVTRKFRVTVGIHSTAAKRPPVEGKKTKKKPNNAQVGTWHEFGTSKFPQRSFLRSTADENKALYLKLMGLAMARASKGLVTPVRALELFGLKVRNDVKKKIRAQIPPPLADSTVIKKGSSTPLIDTGQLINSIGSKVRRGAGKI